MQPMSSTALLGRADQHQFKLPVLHVHLGSRVKCLHRVELLMARNIISSKLRCLFEMPCSLGNLEQLLGPLEHISHMSQGIFHALGRGNRRPW